MINSQTFFSHSNHSQSSHLNSQSPFAIGAFTFVSAVLFCAFCAISRALYVRNKQQRITQDNSSRRIFQQKIETIIVRNKLPVLEYKKEDDDVDVDVDDDDLEMY